MRFGPYRTVSFGGCSSTKVPDSERNRGWLGKCTHGGYPQVELMTLVETGTRAVIGAVFGPTREGETSYATRLLQHLSPGTLVLWDRGFDGNGFLAAVHATGAQVLSRINKRRRPPVLKPLPDFSYLSVIGGVRVRIIEAQVSITCTDDSTFDGSYRLVTTLLDARRYPADHLVRLYHERWEHESAYDALRHTILHGRVLRSNAEQEMWSLLTLYQLLRRPMVETAESQLGADPDRCGFTIALQTARDLLVRAQGVLEQGIGEIGRRLLSALSPAVNPDQHPQGEVPHLPLHGAEDGRPPRRQSDRDIHDSHTPAAAGPGACTARGDHSAVRRPRQDQQPHGTRPGHPSGRTRTTLAGTGDRRAPRRCHPRCHLPATRPLDRERTDRESPYRPLRGSSTQSNTPCVTRENVNYPALGRLHLSVGRPRGNEFCVY
ncbi:transposase (plasmid) [Streptomyces sp. ITFR-6]|nr:transposase [Streptomyces sp. ITFR-6]WNI34506.1 transposase [Streptomyces sp. ITFR-6]